MNTGFVKRAALYIGILAFALVLLLFLGAGQASAEDVSGDITVDTTWTSGNTYNVTGDVNVNTGVTLTIQNNVTVIFESDYSIGVYGELLVQGTADSPVTFTWNESTMNYGWIAMAFLDGSSGSVAYADISHVFAGIYLENESIPISNVNFNDTNYGIVGEFNSYGATVSLSLHDLSFCTIWDLAIGLWNGNGSLDVTLDGIYVDDSYSFLDLEAFTPTLTGTVELSMNDVHVNDTSYGLVIEADVIGSIDITDTGLTNMWASEYAIWLENDPGDMVIVLSNAHFENCYGILYANNLNGSLDVTLDNVTTDNTYEIASLYATAFGGNGNVDLTIIDCSFNDSDYGIHVQADMIGDVQVSDTEFTNLWAWDYLLSLYAIHGDMEIGLDNVIMDNIVNGLYARTNGSVMATFNEFHVSNGTWSSDLYASSSEGTGALTLTVTNSSFSNVADGLYTYSYGIEDIEIIDTEFYNVDNPVYLYAFNGTGLTTTLVMDGVIFDDISNSGVYLITRALTEVQVLNSVFTGIINYGLNLYSVEGDTNFVMDNVTMYNFNNGFYLQTDDGSITAALNEVHTDYSWWVGGWWAYSTDGTARVDFTVTDSTFNDTVYGIWYYSEVSGDVTVTDTEFTGVYDDAALTQASPTVGDMSMVLTNVIMDNVWIAIDPVVIGNITLVMDNVHVNDTYEVGYFEATNGDGTAWIDVTISDSSFTNCTYGLMFVSNTFGDYSVTDTEFAYIDYYATAIKIDYGDLVMPLVNVQSTTVGTVLDVTVTFGNVEVEIIDSMLSGNNATGVPLISVIVGSNSLSNGFVTLTVSNSTLMNAGGGIWVWCEELVPVMMTDTVFVNIMGECMRFDVRTGDVDFAFDDDEISIIDSGIGLWIYLNDGSFDLTMNGAHLITTMCGVYAEVSSMDDTELSVINVEVMDSVLEGGYYGIYALSLNGGEVLIDGSQFLGHDEAGYYFDSLYGDVNVTITDSVFDGSPAASMGIYIVEQVEYEFELVGRWGDWDATQNTNGGTMVIDLPFTFTYGGVAYDQVTMDDDGYLWFEADQYIAPVGYTTDLRYNNDQFYGYMVADDNSSIMFTWYAAESTSQSLSMAFQVILYADGQIRINYADMDMYNAANIWFGLMVDGDQYDLRDRYDILKWETDLSSYLFTPVYMSMGMGAMIVSEEGDIMTVLTNNTVTSYYKGGMAFLASHGDVVLEASLNTFSKIAGDWYDTLNIWLYNGTTDINVTDNTFELIWCWGMDIWVRATEGGANSIVVSDNVFHKVAYGVYSYLYVNDYDDISEGNDTYEVIVDFQDNVMTDAFGLICWIDMYLYQPVSWDVSVQQTMTGNTMVQEEYLGSWPFMTWVPSDCLGSYLYMVTYHNEMCSVVAEQTSTVTNNVIEIPVSGCGIYVGNYVYNEYGNTTSTLTTEITDNTVEMMYGGWAGIYTDSYLEIGSGVMAYESSIIVENNQIFDVSQDIIGIEVYQEAGTYSNTEESVDADILSYISVVDNLVDGAWYGIYSYVDYYNDNTIGDWNVSPTVHIDNNQLLNVSYCGVYSDLWAGVYFTNDYWPLEDEVAVGNMVLDYLFTIDDNVITCVDSMHFDGWLIIGEAGYWAQVDPSTLFTEANVWVTGTFSISRNQMTEVDAEVNGIFAYNGIWAMKNGTNDVAVDMVIEDNTMAHSWTSDSHGPGPGTAIWLESDIEAWTSSYIETDVPTIMADMSWSVTGNDISGAFREGVTVIDYLYVEYGMSSLFYDVSWDISDNTLTDLRSRGIDYQLHRYEDTMGSVELNIDVAIQNNMVSIMWDGPGGPGIAVDSWWDYDTWVDPNDVYGRNVVFEATVTDNTVCGAQYGLYLLGKIYDDEPFEDGTVWTFVNSIVAENNYISDCEYGLYLEGAVALANNALEECDWGVFWYLASGEISGIALSSCFGGIYLYEPLDVVVSDNQIEFWYNGIYVEYGDYDETRVQILGNTLTGVDMYDNEGIGIYLYETINAMVDGNVITNGYYGVLMQYVYNVTLSNNQVLESGEYGVLVYYAEDVTIESNNVTDGDGYGIYIDYYCWEFIIGNNTITWNEWTGLYIYYYETWDIVLYNNVIMDNGNGVDAEGYEGELVWYVDAACQVSRNDANFAGELIIMSGGTMVLEDMCMYVHDITVEEGGLLSMSDICLNTWFLDVYGTLWATLSEIGESDVYLAPSACAEIRSCWFYYSDLLIDGCDATVTDSRFDGYMSSENYAIAIRNGAAPTIVSNLIIDYWYGIYANGMDMGGIYDNLIVGNYIGLLTEDCTGTVHDNIFLGNDVAILLRNSDVSVEDNEIGYTDLYQIMANYATVLSLISDTAWPEEVTDCLWDGLEAILAYACFDPWSLYDWVNDHTYGIWSESSMVQTSGNTYGLLSYAVYAVDSEVHFADDVRTTEMVIPWVIVEETYTEVYNYTANVYTLNGIFAARSDVYVNDCTIEVVDDALMFEASNGWVEGATLMAGDFDYFLYGGSEVYNIDATYSKAKVEDSHSLNEGTWLTINVLDNGDPAANVTVVIVNAKGETVFNGTTDADGQVKVLLAQYAWTSEGKDDGFNPYTITAYIGDKEKSKELTLNESYMEITIGSKGTDMGAILAVIGVLVIILLIVAAVVVMRRRK